MELRARVRIDSTIKRQRLVQELQGRGIADRRVLDALAAIPRERFIEEALGAKAYSDAPLPIGERQTISQPWIVGRMSELLEPDGKGRVLEIGTGSGYQAAVLSRLFELVYTVERIRPLSIRARETIRALEIENVHFKIFDGTLGWGEFAPYRSILVTAAAPEIPEPLLGQLRDGGRLVLPLAENGSRETQVLVRVTRRGERYETERFERCRFVPLVGRFGWKEER